MSGKTGEQIKIAVVIVLAVVFVILGYFQLFHKKTDAEARSTPHVRSEPEVDIGSIESEVQNRMHRRQASSVEPFQPIVRDIFTPSRSMKKAALPRVQRKKPKPRPLPRLRLKGTIVEAGRSIAIINDRFLREGDLIHGFKLVRIGKKEVLLKSGSRQLALEMKKNE